jgi:hypothetical protein
MLFCMAPAAFPTTDPVELVRQLKPDEIRQRLNTMERERRALLVLLRAALANQKSDKSREVARA